MNQQETAAPSVSSKKQVRKEIFEKLKGALADYTTALGEKKLATRVKKASKLISRDLEKQNKKNRQRIKKGAGKKKATQKATKATKATAQHADHA